MSKYEITDNNQLQSSGFPLRQILCLVFIMPLACAIIRYHFVRITNGYALCLICYLGMILTIAFFLGKSHQFDNLTLSLCLFLLFYGLIIIFTNDSVLTYNLIFIVPIMVFSHISIDIDDKQFRTGLIVLSAIMFTITMIMTIQTLILYPGAARVLASKKFTKYGYDMLVKRGTGGFEFIYALTPLIPIGLSASLHAERKIRIPALCFTVLGIVTVLLSGYTTAILLMLLAVILTLCTINRWILGIVIVLTPVTIILFLSQRMEIASFVMQLSSRFSSRAVAEHLVELANIIAQKNDVDSLDRMALYQHAIEYFSANPIFGSYIEHGQSGASGHSTILDLLAGGGLVCTVPFFCYIYLFYRKILSRLSDFNNKFSWNTTTVIFVILLFANPIFGSPLIYLAYFSLAAVMQTIMGERAVQHTEEEKKPPQSKYIK